MHPWIPFLAPFQDHFRDPFWSTLSRILGPKTDPNICLELVRKLFLLLVHVWSFFSVSELPLDALLQSSGRLGAVLGSLKSEKMQTVRCENHLFESRLCRFLEVYLALLGSSGLLPDQSCRPDCTQNRLKNVPKIGPKDGPKWDPILSRAWTHFGAYFGVQNGGIRGPLFQGSSGWLQSPILAPSWPHFGSVLASLGFILAPSWPLLASSWPHLSPILALLASLGALLALSWLHLGTMLAHLGCTWPHLGPSWLHLGPILAPSGLFVVSWWTTGTQKAYKLNSWRFVSDRAVLTTAGT